MDVVECDPRQLLQGALDRYCDLLQCDILLLDGEGRIYLSKDPRRWGTQFFSLPLEQCLHQVICTKGQQEEKFLSYRFCLPVNAKGCPAFYVAMESCDSASLPHDCGLVALGLSVLTEQMKQSTPLPAIGTQRDLQTLLIESLLSKQMQQAQIQVIIDSLGLDASLLRAVICIELVFWPTSYFVQTNELEYDPMVEKLRGDILALVRGHRLLNHQDVSTVYHQNELIIIKSFIPTTKIAKVYQTLEAICKQLKQDLSRFGSLEMKMAHGNITYHFYDLHNSYFQAKEFLLIGRRQHPQLDYYNSEALMLDLICSTLHPQIMAKMVIPILDSLRDANGAINEELLLCAETIVDKCLSYTLASQKMSLHRNTLHLRLERFCILTKLDPFHNFQDALAIKLAAIAYRDGRLVPQKEE